MKVFKYSVPVNDQWVEIDIPKGSDVIYVNVQGDNPKTVFFWVIVYNNMENTKEKRYFRVYGTGHNIPEERDMEHFYIGSCMWRNGELVWHLFEKIEWR